MYQLLHCLRQIYRRLAPQYPVEELFVEEFYEAQADLGSVPVNLGNAEAFFHAEEAKIVMIRQADRCNHLNARSAD